MLFEGRACILDHWHTTGKKMGSGGENKAHIFATTTERFDRSCCRQCVKPSASILLRYTQAQQPCISTSLPLLSGPPMSRVIVEFIACKQQNVLIDLIL